jgi:hypothetical protein
VACDGINITSMWLCIFNKFTKSIRPKGTEHGDNSSKNTDVQQHEKRSSCMLYSIEGSDFLGVKT